MPVESPIPTQPSAKGRLEGQNLQQLLKGADMFEELAGILNNTWREIPSGLGKGRHGSHCINRGKKQ